MAGSRQAKEMESVGGQGNLLPRKMYPKGNRSYFWVIVILCRCVTIISKVGKCSATLLAGSRGAEVNSSIVLISAVLASLASGVLVAYGICIAMFGVFRMHARQVAAGHSSRSVVAPA